ncbi:hypothetical protein MPEAHAMD_4377 [Methylobacterium frigidaeris]|uniref:Uncharacterized protein n=1 Tax=Methylobacterium frigidaeris TaxID=2038277 RepID=A0AA37HDV1_9HYPH|nr:hypothetical protein MPEAHAMD_4377 [Methylobacterium frigidaeris]
MIGMAAKTAVPLPRERCDCVARASLQSLRIC